MYGCETCPPVNANKEDIKPFYVDLCNGVKKGCEALRGLTAQHIDTDKLGLNTDYAKNDLPVQLFAVASTVTFLASRFLLIIPGATYVVGAAAGFALSSSGENLGMCKEHIHAVLSKESMVAYSCVALVTLFTAPYFSALSGGFVAANYLGNLGQDKLIQTKNFVQNEGKDFVMSYVNRYSAQARGLYYKTVGNPTVEQKTK